MKAIVIDQAGGGTLRVEEVPDPAPSATQLLVVVHAAGVNRADLSQRAGRYRHSTVVTDARQRPIAGLELAGVVVAVGADVRGFAPGDRVMALAGGAYAELAVVEEALALPVPSAVGDHEAAAVPVAFMTAHDALVTHGLLEPGSDVLITAAASVVGLAAVQIARLRGARRIFGTARSPRHADRLNRAGLTDLLDQADVSGPVLAGTAGLGVPLSVDHVGGPLLAPCLAATAVAGRYVSVGRLAGTSSTLDLDALAKRRQSIIGVSFRTRSTADTGRVAARMHEDLGPALAGGDLRPVLDRVFPMAQIDRAHEYLVHGQPFGKVVLTTC